MENINEILQIVENARTTIALAKGCRDGRKREKRIKEAKLKAQELLEPIKAEINTCVIMILMVWMICSLGDLLKVI